MQFFPEIRFHQEVASPTCQSSKSLRLICRARRRRIVERLFALLLVLHPYQAFLLGQVGSSLRLMSCHHPPSSSTRLMGIKGFRSWFASQFPDAIGEVTKGEDGQEFDHVLIDVNPLLHVAVRKGLSDGHALALLMRDLDNCLELAKPRKSLVLAMDGPPGAAKLATQRSRRYSMLVRTEWKLNQLNRFRKSINPRTFERIKSRYERDITTLRITPGTDLMNETRECLLYWIWQRMQFSSHFLGRNGVEVFLSTSDAPGEGEIKMVDWINNYKPSGSVALLGGDSDLVIEGWVQSPAKGTHDLFVLLPDANKRYFVVSIWESTRTLARLLPELPARDMMRVRTDLALLMILNGNDYFPQLRASYGFDRILQTYLKLLRQYLKNEKETKKKGPNGAKTKRTKQPFLVEPNTLEFNLEFARDFFGRMRSNDALEKAVSLEAIVSETPVGQLHNLIGMAFMPKPLKWTIEDREDSCELDATDDSGCDTDGKEGTAVHEKDVINGDQVQNDKELDDDGDGDGYKSRLLRLTLGQPGTRDFLSFEMEHKAGRALKTTKNKLATLALEHFLGAEYSDEDGVTSQLSYQRYDWEIQFPKDGDVEDYLGGLLWNLQTYQDGVCADYGYNYGKRMSPSAASIADFFQQAINEKRSVGKKELLGDKFTPSVNAGVTCLAATPTEASYLIPPPYSSIPAASVEEMYAACVSREDNVFDIAKFGKLCNEKVGDPTRRESVEDKRSERKIRTGVDYWTVLTRRSELLSNSVQPPRPRSEKFSNLRRNRRIAVYSQKQATQPLPRPCNGNARVNGAVHDHKSMLPLLQDKDNIEDVKYFVPFRSTLKKKKKTRKAERPPLVSEEKVLQTETKKETKKEKKPLKQVVFDVDKRMSSFNLQQPSRELVTNSQGLTAARMLKALEVSGVISFQWTELCPSPTAYAAVDPEGHECLRLTIQPGAMADPKQIAGPLVFEQDRSINKDPKKRLRQHLSGIAMQKMIGPANKNWYEMTAKELVSLLRVETHVE